MTYLELHETLLYAAASAQGALSAGARDPARATLVRALEQCGVPVARPIDGPDVESTPAVLLLTAATVEDSIVLSVIPEADVTPELRAALEDCDRREIRYDTLDEDPELAAAHALVTGETVWPYGVMQRDTGEVRAGCLCRPLTRVYFVFEWT